MRHHGRNVMRSVKIDKKELLGIVRENMTKHVTEYDEAVLDYKKAVVKIAQENFEIATRGDLKEMKGAKAWPIIPVSYEDSYKRAIRMLELSVDKVIELEDDVFGQLVLDEWDWKEQFSLSNATYKSY